MTTRIDGLDSLRFFCALAVCLHHLLPSPFAHWVNGPAAVLVFFVISGFCVHYPYRVNRHVPCLSHWVRRYLRVGLPLIAIILLGKASGTVTEVLEFSILWSVVCELYYYALYPLILKCLRQFGWKRVLVVSYIAALAVILTQPDAYYFNAFSWRLNWIVGLPSWLLGCLLAENWEKTKITTSIWVYRCTALTLSVLTAHFQNIIGFPWTLTLFAVFVYFWLAQEILHFKHHTAWPWSQWAGQWSYSFYLCHIPAAQVLVQLGLTPLHWALQVGAAIIFSLVFYYLIEWPSHQLGRRVSKKFY